MLIQMIETEVKIKVEDLHDIKRRIKQKGGTYESSFFEDNIVFDDPQGTLHEKEYLLRLRKSDHVTVTVKTPMQKGRYKVMQEYEIQVSDFDQALSILNILGYQKVFRYQKMREIFSFQRTKVFLDDTPIGNYIEIEGEGGDIEQTAKLLGLDFEKKITKNYIEVYHDYCRENGLEPGDMIY
jgi:adenylate cyclase class 2